MAIARREGPRLPPPKSEPNTTATRSGQTIVKKNAAFTRYSTFRSLSAMASTADMGVLCGKSSRNGGWPRRSVAERAAGEVQEHLLEGRLRDLELGRHRGAARRRLAIQLGERLARLDAFLAGIRPQDQRRRTAVGLRQPADRVERQQLAVVDDRDAIAEALGLLHVVRGVDDGLALVAQGEEAVEDRVARLRIDADEIGRAHV